VSEDGVQGRHGPRRDALAAGRGAATAADARFRSFAGRDVGLRALDVAELERTDLPAPEKRLTFSNPSHWGRRGENSGRLEPASSHRPGTAEAAVINA
jgi:hypothetical protein